MPFTFSHPAAVLPIPRRRLSLSAMMIGAMAPDFPYFILLSHTTIYGHTLPGVFQFCLPASLLLLWLYHRVFKRPLLALAPDHLARRISEQDLQFSFWPPSRLAWVAASVVIGSFTHILWDDFTHERGLFVTMAPELRLYFGPHMPLFAILQLGSTVVGAGLLAWAYMRWARRVSPKPDTAVPQLSIRTRAFLFTACLAIMAVCAIPYGIHFANDFPLHGRSVFIVKSIIASIAVGFIELVAYSVAWHLAKEKAPAAEYEG